MGDRPPRRCNRLRPTIFAAAPPFAARTENYFLRCDTVHTVAREQNVNSAAIARQDGRKRKEQFGVQLWLAAVENIHRT
jgi:hypothetical protein